MKGRSTWLLSELQLIAGRQENAVEPEFFAIWRAVTFQEPRNKRWTLLSLSLAVWLKSAASFDVISNYEAQDKPLSPPHKYVTLIQKHPAADLAELLDNKFPSVPQVFWDPSE